MGGGSVGAELSWLVAGRAIAGDLAPALVSPLDDVPGDALGSEAKRYGGCQGNCAKYDEERRSCKLHSYPQFCQGCEDCVDDDRIPG